ncbi:GGDEF domain-containing protein [Curvibacter sp. APW13]|uniref:GGDEF domain-containing protein n=1 Tax=Curvibacter sp. APW13 TaxID=3077236 RepID=UPI0028E005F1|nr:GGDEF domain-containing protein [Curvibacter sp. APW13]MDT8992606.1 GGDEF domain-containing protein [Curvibacter sp. APW13]
MNETYRNDWQGKDGRSDQVQVELSADATDACDYSEIENLLTAVCDRLNLISEDLPEEVHSLRQSVVQCARALEHVQNGISREIAKAELAQQELLDTRFSLGRVRESLVALRGGERRAHHRATHDSLTLLPNRELFRSRLLQAVNRAKSNGLQLAVLFLDLDGFKQVNDTHGHAAGDQLLRVVAARLNHSVRIEDVVSRFGGDEFACMLTGFGSDADLHQLAAKLYEDVSGICKVGDEEVMVTPSIGIALWPMDGDTAERLIGSADAAMYRAKRTRTGFAFCEPGVGLSN